MYDEELAKSRYPKPGEPIAPSDELKEQILRSIGQHVQVISDIEQLEKSLMIAKRLKHTLETEVLYAANCLEGGKSEKDKTAFISLSSGAAIVTLQHSDEWQTFQSFYIKFIDLHI